MNRYRGPTVGAPSKATATTQCQKCLKRGHYSYECKAVAQERPYVSRPSRTQQLLNPKLVPKLTSDIPQDLLRKKGVADEQLARLKEERGRKRERQSEDPESPSDSKRMRSGSSESVSTISTNRSQPPPPRHRSRESARRKATSRSLSVSQSPPRRTYRDSAFDKKRRRGSSVSSEGSDPAGLRRGDTQGSKELTTGRSTRRRYSEHSPPARGRIPRTESQSPDRGRRRLSNDRRRSNDFQRNDIRRSEHRPGANYHNNGFAAAQTTRQREPPKERSLSPFSKRLALTQAMNMR